MFLDAILRAELELAVERVEFEELLFLKLPCEEGMVTGGDQESDRDG